MQVDRSDLIRTLSDLVRINSINPVLVPGAPGEGEIASYVAGWLGDAGLEILMVEPEAGRPSVAARLPGSGGGRSLMLNAHMDTVGVEGMADAWSGTVRDGKLYGRGAYDMKGSLAACMAAAKVLAGEPRLRGDLVIAAVADEEYGSIGTAGLLERVRTDAAIVTEPTSLRICRAHKGYLWIEVEVEGRAAHGSRFDLGIDANLRMGRFLVALEALERELRARPPHPLVGPPSLHAALLEGGTGLSTYAASSRVRIERRTVPGETEAGAVGEIDALLDRLRQADPSLRISRNTFFSRDSFEIGPDAGIVRALDTAARRVLPDPPPHVGDTPWMDSALTAAAGIETVVFGPHGTGAHAAEEWVDVESVVATASVLVETARD
ncbi:MAG TPA: M20/M25/M40 family metallo-hydrolase, partial [Gemmatimonadales bacterium]|nr:M20/M25/M40 family metallo-hydrolase [Gemmatimonadales bacterium]